MNPDFYIARNKELQAWIVEIVKNYHLPFKLQIQPIFPDKSINQLGYLFGVVIKRIADYSGHSPKEVYEAYKHNLKIEYSQDPTGNWGLRIKGASDFDTVDCEEFALMIRADAILEMNLVIELPNECFISELDFAEQDKIEEAMTRNERRLVHRVPKLSYRVFNRKR